MILKCILLYKFATDLNHSNYITNSKSCQSGESMKKKLCSIALTLITLMAQAAETDFTEDFNTFTGSYSSVTNVTLPSGVWVMNGVGANTTSGVKSVKFNNSNAYVISPAIDKPAKVSFVYRSGGSNKPVTVSYSTNGGSTWTDIETFIIQSSSSSFNSWNKKMAELENTDGVTFRILCSASNVYIDDFKVIHSAGGSSTDPVVEPDDPTYVTEGVWVPYKPIPAATGQTYYISPAGNDVTGDGTVDKPWYNLAVAYAAAQPGDHIICKGGTYKINKYGTDGKLTVRMNKQGTAEKPIVIRCADGEKPVFDFEKQLLDCNKQPSKVGDRGILLTGDYHILFGIHIMHAADNAIKLEGNHNRIERCEFSYNLDTGIQLGFGHNFSDSGFGSSNDGSHCAYNDIVDCDSHHNCDCDTNYGSDADGFACKMHNGIGNRFIRCRAWHNSDDAWDLYETDYDVVLAECWAWKSGDASDHTWVKEYLNTSASFSGNGNGIKLGGNGTGGSSKGVHYAFNCIAFGCNKSGSVKGFDCNNHKDGHVLVGCLAFDNGYDYMFESGGADAKTFYYNNVCLGKQEICVGTDDYNAISVPMSKLGWTSHLVTGISADDFISLEEDDALLPRSIDGSLPRRFGRLACDSKMVDAGNANLDYVNNVWSKLITDFPFLDRTITGTARDLGPYERPASVTAIHTIINDARQVSIRKFLMNGRMVIAKNGERYNVLGQKITARF